MKKARIFNDCTGQWIEFDYSKEEKVINYYVLCNKLKNVIRTGWLDWKVKRERIEMSLIFLII